MSNRNLSRREFLGASAIGAVAGASMLVNPARAAAEAVGGKPADLPDLTIKEVKMYVTNLGDIRRINSSEGGEIVSIVTAGGVEGNYTLGNRNSGAGWLEHAKGVCLGKNVLDLLPTVGARQTRRGGGGGGGGGGRGSDPRIGPNVAPRGGGAGRGGRGPAGFIGGFGYPTGRLFTPASEADIHNAVIDVVLWDILGKAVNRPIYKLLGGGAKDRVLAYASSLHLANVEDFAPEAVKAKGEGFRAYKIHPGGGQRASGGEIPAYLGHIEEIKTVRKAVGEDFTLLFDPVQRYNVFEALKVGHTLEETGYVSFEDPIPSTDIEGLIELRQKLDVPIEVGEFLYTVNGFAEYISRGALDIVRLIGDNVGGITGSLRLAQLADAFGLPCTPHNWGNGFDLAMQFQIELAMPNCFWFEMPYPQTLTDRVYLKDQFRIDKNGYVPAPTEPGLGCRLDRDAMEKVLIRIDR